ncbi:adenylate kinase isoenzyme 1 isoform X2 [Culicoides brevitarsis]|uniref:adenylate kinase isoenzyme 1 isoform X2 n=1 Tax=Culicoides brevitarsis TaxID=469753 RepID=UPI00307B6958
MCHQMKLEHDAKEKEKSEATTPTNEHQKSFGVASGSPIIWVLGGPGCGKGTQCDRIIAKYGFSHFSTGDLLRAEVASGSPKGKELQDMMTKGLLVSNQIVLELLEAAMNKVANTPGFLIDGYPREPAQGPEFEKIIAPVDIILYFECSDNTLVTRIMKRAAESAVKRADDNEETLKTRIATFRENTEKILAQYPSQLRRIDAERDVDTIFADVTKAIDDCLATKKTKAAVAQ